MGVRADQAGVASVRAGLICSNDHVFVRVWEYEVTADHVDAFVAAYGGEGDWAQLFRTGRGFLGTELYRRTDGEARFVTVDRWQDHESWHDFLEEFRETYDQLDRTLAHLSASQRCLIEGSD